jgi:hypothetical protein
MTEATPITVTAWEFDPCFQSNMGDNWQAGWSYAPSAPGQTPTYDFTALSPDKSINLAKRLIDIQLIDANGDGEIGWGGDQVIVRGITYDISLAFNGDRILIDGNLVTVVTIYANGWPNGDPLPFAFSIPVDPATGKLMHAFPGTTNATWALVDAQQYQIPVETFPCFASGTLIETGRGAVPVEDLRVGDLVLTRDAGLQPIRWTGSRRLGRAALEAAPGQRPIRIRAGALGNGMPTRDLLVSPQHRILVRSRIAQRMFGTPEVLVAAKQLLALDGIERVDALEEVTYVHLLLDRHHIVLSNGAATETLYTGAEALKALGPATRCDILNAVPTLAAESDPPPARPLLTGRQGRSLAQRHAANGKPLLEPEAVLRSPAAKAARTRREASVVIPSPAVITASAGRSSPPPRMAAGS